MKGVLLNGLGECEVPIERYEAGSGESRHRDSEYQAWISAGKPEHRKALELIDRYQKRSGEISRCNDAREFARNALRDVDIRVEALKYISQRERDFFYGLIHLILNVADEPQRPQNAIVKKIHGKHFNG